MKCSLLLIALFFSCPLVHSKVWINEVVSSNQIINTDEDGNYSDWIELYNDDNTSVELTGSYLSDDEKKPNKWKFPNVVIPAKGYLLVWASGKDKIQTNGIVHTNFSLSADGEPIILSNADGKVIDSLTLPKLDKDIAYARFPDAGENWEMTKQPTPFAKNQWLEKITAPIFSHEGGVFASDFQLTLSHPDPEVKIYYTIDGSEPSSENITDKTYSYKNRYRETALHSKGSFIQGNYKTNVYSTGIDISPSNIKNRISNISTTYDYDPKYLPKNEVGKCVVVKAIAEKNGDISETITHTFFIDKQLGNSWNVPVISISANDTNFFDFYRGLMVAGVDFENWREENPLLPAGAARPANFNRRGEEYEYPIHIEVFDPISKKKTIDQNVGYRIQGSSTRVHPQKSLRLYARNEYGKSNFKYDFFSQESGEEYKRLVLRGHNSLRLGDIVVPNMVHHLPLDVQHNTPVELYLNGEYYGLYDLKERQDQHYIERKYGVHRDSIDLLSDKYEVNEGSNEHFLELIDFVKKNSLSHHANYLKVSEMMDVDNYIDYLIVQIYSGNTDWPHKNIDYWRKGTSSYQADASYGHDGRWRWMLFDMDYAFGLVDKSTCTLDMLEVAIGDGSHWSKQLAFKLLENSTFKQKFVTRAADLLNTTFLSPRLLDVIDQSTEELRPRVPNHLDRWCNGLGNLDELVKRMKNFVECRSTEIFAQYQKRFNLGPQFQVRLDVVDETNENYIRLNTLDIRPSTVGVSENTYPWTGTYFTKVPITVTAVAVPGYVFSHWEGLPAETPQTYTNVFSNDVQLVAHFKKAEIFDVVYTSGVGGFIEGDSIQKVFQNQNARTVEAKPLEGYKFSKWSDGVSKAQRTDENIQQSIHVQALFERSTAIIEHQLKDVFIFPNPSQNLVFIQHPYAEKLEYQILDLKGKVLQFGILSTSNESILLENLSESLYILKLWNQQGESSVFKILKQ